MASFHFSPELLGIIASHSDITTLKTLRLTSHTLCFFATKYLFSEVSLYTEDESCQAFESILTHPQLSDKVYKVRLNTVEVDYDSDTEVEELEPPPKWEKLLTKLPSLSNLESVVLRFDKNCAKSGDWIEPAQSDEYRETIIQWLGIGLGSLRRPLKELGIQNQQNVTPISEEVEEVLNALKSLRLNVVHELEPACPENEIYKEELHKFYETILPSVWLEPTMGSLQKLSLYSSFYWGFWPKLSLDGVHFPNLQSLALGNFSFFKDEQLDWILSHSTLEELYLDDCPILLEARILDNENDLSESPIPKSELEFRKNEDRSDSWHYNYPSRWSNYFASIEAGLPHLRHFAFGHNAAWDYPGGVPLKKKRTLRQR
ncbi:hypothetical protein N7475_007353 [Penicillium sp. IBT 31633x]|nr:hypothetical protein N7475_007353 [Penicillium sp. IBT 31633x]